MVQATKHSKQAETGMYEYLLVAYPDKRVNNKILAIKEGFCSEYLQQPGAGTKPQITIANFKAREAMEDTILRYTQRICSHHPGFEVSLNNYSGVPPHTIYLRVQDPAPFRQLARQLGVVSSYVDSCSCPPVRLYTSPHLSIAAKLSETIYYKAMIDYSQKTFHETFLIDELVLLRRSSEYDTPKTVHVFRLLPVETELLRN